MTNPWQEWKKKNLERQQRGEVGPTALFNPDTPKVSDGIAAERMAICEQCPELLPTKQCRQCGCIMPLKTKLEHATCPLNKW
jgi:hypothetical protein